MQMSPAICIARFTISGASSWVLSTSARAAARAYDPPEPMARIPSSGSISSPDPEMMNPCSLSATMSRASSRRSTRSLRQSLASSTAARGMFPGYRSSFSSNFSNRVMASAAAPANPATSFPPRITRTFWACDFMTVSPTVTWPSPPIATLPLRRTAKMVVARMRGSVLCDSESIWGNLAGPSRRRRILRALIRRATSQRAAVGDRLAEVAAVTDHPEQQKQRARDHGNDGIAPRVPADDCGARTQDAGADRRLAAAMPFDAWPAAALAAHDDLVGCPGVEHQPQPDQPDQDAYDDWDDFDPHATESSTFRTATGCRPVRPEDGPSGRPV